MRKSPGYSGVNIRLVDYTALTSTQREQLRALEVHPEQLPFCGDIDCALYSLPSAGHPGIKGFTLLVGEQPLAFFLLKRHPLLPHWAEPDSATLHALQVDKRAQGQGLGRACLQALPQAARQAWPEIRRVMLSVDPANRPAICLYLQQGWADTGEAYRSKDGFERRLALTL